jgi:signal transduction histidine kinase
VIPSDPLRTIELLAVLDEASTPLRHDVRNRIASIRNLAFFVRRKLSAEPAPARDPRVPEFIAKIEAEVVRTDELIESWSARLRAAHERASGRVRVSECLRLAVNAARLPSTVEFELSLPASDALEVECELEVLAFAVRCLLENAGEAIGSGVVGVRAEAESERCRITVSDDGPGIADAARRLVRFQTSKTGHLGLGLCMARRIATRLGGDLLIGSPGRGAQVSLLIPVAGPRSERAI